MKYYVRDVHALTDGDIRFCPVSESYAHKFYTTVVGIDSHRPLEVGDKVVKRHLRSGKQLGVATVHSIEDGVPFELMNEDGSIEYAAGLILKLIGIIGELWQILKATGLLKLFKRK